MATTILRIFRARTSPTQKFFALNLEFFRAAIFQEVLGSAFVARSLLYCNRDYAFVIALSMIANPSANCSCVMMSGGNRRSV